MARKIKDDEDKPRGRREAVPAGEPPAPTLEQIAEARTRFVAATPPSPEVQLTIVPTTPLGLLYRRLRSYLTCLLRHDDQRRGVVADPREPLGEWENQLVDMAREIRQAIAELPDITDTAIRATLTDLEEVLREQLRRLSLPSQFVMGRQEWRRLEDAIADLLKYALQQEQSGDDAAVGPDPVDAERPAFPGVEPINAVIAAVETFLKQGPTARQPVADALRPFGYDQGWPADTDQQLERIRARSWPAEAARAIRYLIVWFALTIERLDRNPSIQPWILRGYQSGMKGAVEELKLWRAGGLFGAAHKTGEPGPEDDEGTATSNSFEPIIGTRADLTQALGRKRHNPRALEAGQKRGEWRFERLGTRQFSITWMRDSVQAQSIRDFLAQRRESERK
jgi:hypothetical protein